ncbi:glycosyltransferase family 4 protein [soil metagenome]
MKILHIAPQNTAGMPMDFVKMHRSAGHTSNLITIFKNTLDFEEDISIGLSLPSGKFARGWRNKKMLSSEPEKLKYISSKNLAEDYFFRIRDKFNKKKINSIIEKHDLFNYDIYHFDGGVDLFRDVSFAKELKKRGKKIVCCYFGSDLRTRGIFKELDDISDLNLTVEFDHLKLYEGIKYLYFPFDVKAYKFRKPPEGKFKIIHSPTNRAFKGTDKIIPVMEKLCNSSDVEFLLKENMHRDELLKIKRSCTLAIDQVGGEMGGSGYGKNSIENLSIGIPTSTEFSKDYLIFIKDNPFICSTIESLYTDMLKLVEDRTKINELSVSGREWVEKYHSFSSVNERLNSYYIEAGIY